MIERPRHHTLRVPPAVQGASGMIARSLREQPPGLDEVARARMERSLVQAWRTHAAARVPLSRRRPGAVSPRALWAASIAASAVAGGLIGFALFGDAPQTAAPFGAGRFELRIGEAAMQSGVVAEGQMLESGPHGRIEVDLQTARLQMSRGTRVRFNRVSQPELSLSLLKGRLEIDFHPAHKGEQRLSVESRAARVQVLGTRFAVDVDAVGNTEINVREGVVEVLPRSGAPARRLAAGERFYVRADDGDAHERAVRAAIEQGVRALEPVVSDPAEADAALVITADLDSIVAVDGTEAGGRGSRAIARKLEAARRLLRKGAHDAARARLRGLAERNIAVRFRVEALTLMAESYTAVGDVPRAGQAYRKAAELSRSDPAGHNARFALARLLERHAHDRTAAAAAYLSYLDHAPRGALAAQARQALCRLEEPDFCD